MTQWKLSLLGLVTLAAITSGPRSETSSVSSVASVGSSVASVGSAFGKLPLRFEPNVGQTDSAVRFTARGAGYALFLTDREAVISLKPSQSTDRADVVRLTLEGVAADGVRPHGIHLLPGTQNYYVGNADRWRTNVPGYGAVQYSSVYPGIDLVYHATHQELEYDFIVAPGTNPDRIAMSITGADAIEIDEAGDLVMRVGNAAIRQHRPTVFQDIDGSRRHIDGAYVVDGRHVGFAIGEYDRSRPLVIDPVVTLGFSTFVGGSSVENIINAGIAVDSTGHAYITGETSSGDFPTLDAAQPVLAGQYDIYVVKLNPTGTALVYATYIGSRDADEGQDIDVDAEGFAYVSGFTNSIAFPVLNAFQPAYGGGIGDAVVIKLAPDGSLVYSTYLGGKSGFPDRSYERGHAIATDGHGNAFVVGLTGSQNFPTTPGAHRRTSFGVDAFVTKLGPGGALVYSTYVGGRSTDEAYGVAVDAAGQAYVTGNTMSVDNPATPAVNEAFPLVNAIQPVFGGGGIDGFVFKLSADGSTLLYSTYVGGSGAENQSPNLVGTTGDIAVDADGFAYVGGQTNSLNFPTTPGAIKSAPANQPRRVRRQAFTGWRHPYLFHAGGRQFQRQAVRHCNRFRRAGERAAVESGAISQHRLGRRCIHRQAESDRHLGDGCNVALRAGVSGRGTAADDG